jgi:ribosomal-protein-alanine N-acetyltransferase
LNPIHIRLALQRDLKGICRVEDASFAEPYPHYLIVKLLQDCPGNFFVAEYPAGTILGYCVAAENGESAHLISIGVLREYRRQGVGRALIQKLLSNLNSRVKELQLEVKEFNREAITLYEELGFKQINYVENYYEDGSAAVKMFLTIDGARGRPRSGVR